MNRVLHGLERELLNVRNDERLSVGEQSRRLLGIERKLRSVADEMPGATAAATSGAILEDVHQWQEVCKNLELEAPCYRSTELIRDFFERMASALERSLLPVMNTPTAAACIEGLLRTSRLQIEARAELPGEGVGADTFEHLRVGLRERLLACLKHHPVTSEEVARWGLLFCDRADTLITSLDNLPPERGAGRLTLMVSELRWFLEHVDAPPATRRRLRRKIRQLRAEWQERQVQYRMERRFGTRPVAFLERLVLLLILLVLGLMTIELTVKLAPETHFWFHVIDAGACVIFLFEFFTKFALAPERWRWFWRHFLIDFVPSIPFGLLTYGMTSAAADPTRAGRLGRLLRLPRLVRYVRILRPIIRILRGVGLLARGLDRLARQYGHLLNQNVIIYPNRAELRAAYAEDSVTQSHVWRLHGELMETWEDLLTRASNEDACEVASRRLALLEQEFHDAVDSAVGVAGDDSDVREVPAEVLIDRMLQLSAVEAEASLGGALVRQLARNIRLFARPPLRWLPIVRRLVPRLSAEMTEAEVVAAASRSSAKELQRWHDRWFAVSDLYGTVTPSQFIDRLGSTLVKSSMRPAYRLLMFGGILALVQLLFVLTQLSLLTPIEKFLTGVLGPTVMLMGSVCIVVLGMGIWLQRLAREATEFYERSVQAQFLALTEVIRTRQVMRGTEILFERVLRPIWAIDTEVDPALQLQHFRRRVKMTFTGEGEADAFFGMENTLLLYHDWLDGAMFTDVDTRTTMQLLGNPAVRQMITHSERVSKREAKEIAGLDLTRQKAILGGPYLWFNFVTRAIAHSVAQAIIEYNQNAIPLRELDLTPDGERAVYEAWLTGQTDFDRDTPTKPERPAEAGYLTTTFTALHFLDADPKRDGEVAFRFGPRVLTKLKADRRLLIRKIFGTLPRHERPKEDRVVNLFSIYSNWLAGGKALLLPVLLALVGLRGCGSLIKWAWRSLQEIRDPSQRAYTSDAATAPFRTAVRKVDRIRGPVVRAATRLRMVVDPEYLRVPIPGHFESPLLGADIESDADFLHVDPEFRRQIEAETERTEADIRRLETLLEGGLLERIAEVAGLSETVFDSERHLRALTIVYVGDYHGLRGLLSAPDILREIYKESLAEPLRPRSGFFWGLWNKRKFRQFCATLSPMTRRQRTCFWRAICANHWDARRMLSTWSKHRDHARGLAEQTLAHVLRHPARIIEQLMTLRVIQTLAVLDVLNYREHIYALGDYAEDDIRTSPLLNWDTIPERDPLEPAEASRVDTPSGSQSAS